MDASLREGPDIIEILERFEKRPVDCRVNPDKEELNAGGESLLQVGYDN